MAYTSAVDWHGKSLGINVSSFLTANTKETDKTSNCVGEMGRWVKCSGSKNYYIALLVLS